MKVAAGVRTVQHLGSPRYPRQTPSTVGCWCPPFVFVALHDEGSIVEELVMNLLPLPAVRLKVDVVEDFESALFS